jgi:hypothetical protein
VVEQLLKWWVTGTTSIAFITRILGGELKRVGPVDRVCKMEVGDLMYPALVNE